MAVVTLVSAAGSPGVSTTALGMALTWPRPVLLVEADPSGSSAILAGYLRGTSDHVGLVDLVMAHRSGLLSEALPRMVMRLDGEQGRVSVLVGSRSHDQAAGLARLWEPLVGVLRELSADGQDVIVDAGRLGLASWPRPLVAHSDVTALVTRSSLPALVAARSWAAALAEDVLPGHEARLLMVGEGRPYGVGEAARTLGLSSLAGIEWDPARAAVFSEGAAKPKPRFGGEAAADRSFEQSGYVASLRGAGAALRKVCEGIAVDPLRGLITARAGSRGGLNQ